MHTSSLRTHARSMRTHTRPKNPSPETRNIEKKKKAEPKTIKLAT